MEIKHIVCKVDSISYQHNGKFFMCFIKLQKPYYITLHTSDDKKFY